MATVSPVACGFTVSVAVFVRPLYVADSVTGVLAATVCVVTVNVALVEPAATVTVPGTVAADVLLLVRETTAPPDGAAAVSATVPVDGLPPVTVDGLTLTALRLAGAAVPVCTRTATQSRKKSREVEPATVITRTRKLALAKFAALHVRPQVSVELPSVNVPMLVPSVAVDLAAVHVVPPSQESCTH